MSKIVKPLLIASLLTAALFLSGCGTAGIGSKLPPPTVALDESCEALAQRVSHFPVTRGKTDARDAYEGEASRVDAANDRLDATRECQEGQRKRLGGSNAR